MSASLRSFPRACDCNVEGCACLAVSGHECWARLELVLSCGCMLEARDAACKGAECQREEECLWAEEHMTCPAQACLLWHRANLESTPESEARTVKEDQATLPAPNPSNLPYAWHQLPQVPWLATLVCQTRNGHF